MITKKEVLQIVDNLQIKEVGESSNIKPVIIDGKLWTNKDIVKAQRPYITDEEE